MASQFFAHDFLQVMTRPQLLQSLRGRVDLFPLKSWAIPLFFVFIDFWFAWVFNKS
ncbi:MAG: hypothetical protein RLZZ627_330 [Pseudomonadota bacterium]